MKYLKTKITTFKSKRYGWVARKLFITNGSTNYAVSKRGFISKVSAEKHAEKMKW